MNRRRRRLPLRTRGIALDFFGGAQGLDPCLRVGWIVDAIGQTPKHKVERSTDRCGQIDVSGDQVWRGIEVHHLRVAFEVLSESQPEVERCTDNDHEIGVLERL